jgi:hypothetical protein
MRALLRSPEQCHRVGKGRQPGDQVGGLEDLVVRMESPNSGDQPRHRPQTLGSPVEAWHPAVRFPSGTIKTVGSARGQPTLLTVDNVSGDSSRIRDRCHRRSRDVPRTASGRTSNLLGRPGHLIGGICETPCRRSRPGRCPRAGLSPASRAHRRRSRGRVKSAASRPPPYQTALPSAARDSGNVTAYPVTSLGLTVLYLSLTITPAALSRATKSCWSIATAAVVRTWRRNRSLHVSRRHARSAFSNSARCGRRAAVRSAGAVRRSPYRLSNT